MRFAKMHPGAIAPTRKHPGDAGFDVYALQDEQIYGNAYAIMRTGITVEIPEGYCLQLWPKSRNNHLVGAGILDAGYQGEILVKVVNFMEYPMIIHAGEPVAQAVLVKIDAPALEELGLDEIHKETTARGATGGIVSQVAKN